MDAGMGRGMGSGKKTNLERNKEMKRKVFILVAIVTMLTGGRHYGRRCREI